MQVWYSWLVEFPFVGRGSTLLPEVYSGLDIRSLPSAVCLKFMELVHSLEFFMVCIERGACKAFFIRLARVAFIAAF